MEKNHKDREIKIETIALVNNTPEQKEKLDKLKKLALDSNKVMKIKNLLKAIRAKK